MLGCVTGVGSRAKERNGDGTSGVILGAAVDSDDGGVLGERWKV